MVQNLKLQHRLGADVSRHMHYRNIFGFNITLEAIVGLIITLGTGWDVKNIKFTYILNKKIAEYE